MSAPAVFLDRDGVINRYRADYVRTPEDFDYYENTPAAFARLGDLSLPIVVVTNQSGIGRGFTTAEIVEQIHSRLRADVAEWGAEIVAIEVCPHTPDDACECRKPAPGMFLRAAERLDLDLAGSYLVGDAPGDIEAATRLGMHPVRVRTGRGVEALPPEVAPETTENDLLAAVDWIAARCADKDSR